MYDHFTDYREIPVPNDNLFPTLEEAIADVEAAIRQIEEDPLWYAELNCMMPELAARELDRLYCRLEALQCHLEGVQQVEREFAAAA